MWPPLPRLSYPPRPPVPRLPRLPTYAELTADAVDFSLTGLVTYPALWWLGGVGLVVTAAGLLTGLRWGQFLAWVRDVGSWLGDL